MAGKIGMQLEAATSSGSSGGSSAARPPGAADDGPLVVVPAGFLGDVLGGLTGAIGEITGGFFGHARLGREIGDAASPLARLLPFQVLPPSPTVGPQSTGPDAATPGGADEALIVVPAGFLGGLLGGIGGQLLGGAVGGWLGSESTGKTVGSTFGGLLGGLLPFQVVPPGIVPQTTGPEGQAQQEAMVVVPAGFFGDLLGGLAGTVGGLIGGQTGRQIGETASPLIRLLPFQDVPSELAPQSTGPDGAATQERMVVVPAGFFGNLLSGLAGTVGGAVGGLFGDARTGQNLGNAAAPLLGLLPFHEVPTGLLPQSAGTASGADPQSKMMLVPASLFGSLLSCWSGTLTGVVRDLTGQGSGGTATTTAAAAIRDMVPFQAVRPSMATV